MTIFISRQEAEKQSELVWLSCLENINQLHYDFDMKFHSCTDHTEFWRVYSPPKLSRRMCPPNCLHYQFSAMGMSNTDSISER